MAEKKKKSSGRKTAPKKKTPSTRRRKTDSSQDTPPAISSSQRAPRYLLIILILLAAIIILVNQYFSGGSVKTGTRDTAPITAQKKIQETDEGDSFSNKKDKTDVQGMREQKNTKHGKENSSQTAESRMKIYFLRVDERTERVSLVPVTRLVKGEASLEKALGELIKGPNSIERSKGILSAVPSNIRIRGISVKNGVAEIDFNDAVERNAAGSILISRLDQIVYTATEVAGVHSIAIKINGKRKQVFGSDGLSIGGPLHRRQ